MSTPCLWLCGSSGRWQPRLSYIVHSELSRFLNCRTVVALVELSFCGALLSKWHPEVHKSRVSLSYSWVYIYFDHVIWLSQEPTSPVTLPSWLVYIILVIDPLSVIIYKFLSLHLLFALTMLVCWLVDIPLLFSKSLLHCFPMVKYK